jgi:multiple sugar transport system permease protein
VTAAVGRRQRTRGRGIRGQALWFWVFVGPFAAGLLVFGYVPIGWSVLLSFFRAQNTVSPDHFVGFGNYADMLRDDGFTGSLLTFTVFAVFIVPLTFAIALGLALLVNQVTVARAFFRSAFFLPAACSYVVAATIWKMSIFPGVHFGLANTVLGWFGAEPVAWVQSVHPPWYWVVLVTLRLWLQVGFYMILFLAALQRISPELYEAAYTDGAAPGWQTFRYITLPQLRATSLAVLILLLINAYQAFDEFYNVLSSSRGYPTYARPPLIDLYYTALGQGQDFGHGSAGALILTVLIAVVTIGQGRILGFGRDERA